MSVVRRRFRHGVTTALQFSIPNSRRIEVTNCSWSIMRRRVSLLCVMRQPRIHSASPESVIENFWSSCLVVKSDSDFELEASKMSSMLVAEIEREVGVRRMYVLQSDSHCLKSKLVYARCRVKYHCLPAWRNPYSPFQRCQNGFLKLKPSGAFI